MQRKEEYRLRKIGNGYLLVPVVKNRIQTEKIRIINETGAFLWEQLKEEKTENDLLEAVLSEYETDREAALCDIRDFVQASFGAGMITEDAMSALDRPDKRKL